VLVVPGPEGGFRKGDAAGADPKYAGLDMHRRYERMILSAVKLFPRCAGIMTAGSLMEAQRLAELHDGPVYPVGYTVAEPDGAFEAGLYTTIGQAAKAGRKIPATRASEGARAFVREQIAEIVAAPKLITITLREAPYKPEVNSDLAAWSSFARQVDYGRFAVMVVRDAHCPFRDAARDFDELGRHGTFPEASLDLDIRAALYEQAWLNLWTANGASFGVAFANPQIRFLQFSNLAQHPMHTAKHFRSRYLIDPDQGEQPPYFTPFQRITWRDEREPGAIAEEFATMATKIESAEATARGALRVT